MAKSSNVGTGRKRKPTAAHKRDGTYEEYYHGGRNEPKWGKAVMTPPAELNAGGKKEWDRLAPELAQLGLFTRADRAVFAVYCQAWADWVALTKRINKLKDMGTSKTKTGYLMVSPLFGLRKNAWQTMKESATRFGLDPSSRAGLDVPMAPKDGQTDEGFFYGKPRLEPK